MIFFRYRLAGPVPPSIVRVCQELQGKLDPDHSELDRLVLERSSFTKGTHKKRFFIEEKVDWTQLEPLQDDESETINMSILLKDHRAIQTRSLGVTVRPIGWIAWVSADAMVEKVVTAAGFRFTRENGQTNVQLVLRITPYLAHQFSPRTSLARLFPFDAPNLMYR